MKGHIRKRGENSWAIVVDLGPDPETGKRRRQWQTVKGTKRDAERVRREILHSIETGTHVKPIKMTVGQFLNQWLEDYVAINTAPKTAEGYRVIVNRHLIPNLGAILLTQLQPSHLQGYYTRALSHGRVDGKGGLSARTVLHIHRVISEALTHAAEWQMVARNIAMAVKPPRPRQPQITTLAQEEVGVFLSEAAASPYYDLFYTALYTGMRRGELLGLRWKDIDLDLAQLSVSQTIQRIPGKGFVIQEPKTGRSRRSIALSPSVCILLRQRREHQQSESILLGKAWHDDALVFGNLDGQPLDPSTLTHAFRRIVKKAAIPHIRFHDLRHTHATLMLKQGIHPKIVSERLGHSNIGITLDTYSHVMPGLQEAAARRFEEDLLGAVENAHSFTP